MGLLFLMSILQKIFLCFSWTLLPILLRQQGVDLGRIGFTALIFSPWALKFLYASMVDRFYSRRMGRRKSWITPLLLMSWAMFPLLTLVSPDGHLERLLTIVFVLNVMYATMDIAVDGYATDILQTGERAWGNAVQMIAYMMGYMLGGGVFLMVYQYHGWTMTVLAIALLQLILMIPVIGHKEMSAVLPERRSAAKRQRSAAEDGTWAFIRRPGNVWFFTFLVAIAILEQGGAQLRLPMVADMGITTADFGRLTLWIGSPMSIAGACLGAILLNRLGHRRMFVAACLGAVGVSFFSAFVSRTLPACLWQIGMMVGLEKLMIGILFTFVYSMIMSFSAGPQAATRYAVMCSLTRLAGLGIMPVTGNLCDAFGYFRLYMGLGMFGVLFLFAGGHILRYRLEIPI